MTEKDKERLKSAMQLMDNVANLPLQYDEKLQKDIMETWMRAGSSDG